MALVAGAAPYHEDLDSKNPAIKEFNDHVHRYMDLHKKVEDSLPPIDKTEKDPAKIVAHQKTLRSAIASARPKAARGDIFTPQVQPIFLDIIKRQLASGRGAKARSMVLGEGNPRNDESPAKVDLRVNAEYPAKAPLSTVPPSLLLKLPPVPKGLEYRFVGRHLILFDSPANLIVDVLPDAIR
jgi:hypothetical protein